MARRILLAAGALFLLLAAVGIGALVAGGEENEQESVLIPFSEPPRITPNGQVVNLTAAETKFIAGGRYVSGRGYNGQFVGPTLVLKPEETLKLHLRNDLREMTNLHYHGFHVSPKAPSDQVIEIMVQPHETYDYQVAIPADHDQGTFWYHSHNHHTSEGQVFGGMSGAALIGTPPVPPPVQLANDRLIALKDFYTNSKGEIPLKQCEGSEAAPECIDSDYKGTTRTVNGLVNPLITAAPGQIELWRLANIGADIFYDVQLENTPFWVLTEDGNAENELWPAKHLVLPPGKRYDVLVQFGGPRTYKLKTLEYNTGPDGDEYPEATLATVNVNGPREKTPSLAELTDRSPVALPQPTGPPKVKRLTEEPKTNTFMINKKVFEPGRIDDYVPLGAVEDWVFINETKEQHPIHLHQDDFWVIERAGRPVTPKGQQDTVIVYPGEEVKIRIQFTDFTGKFVYHCHILAHEDRGMMAVVDVYPPGGKRGGASSRHSGHQAHQPHHHVG
jgi:FtsP/CotA-like multicopper oxidase with cupredoxin domain